jgi:putative mRNA 3-end processing factor
MSSAKVDVLSSGAVCLGTSVVCDGFVQGYQFRIQTHLHDDHMAEFERSKGLQDIFLTPESFALLLAEQDADIGYRTNLYCLGRGTVYVLPDGSRLTLLPSNHMLGACQVALQLPNGLRVGYSGDFGWPIDNVIQVDELVVDSTYGSPQCIRRYTQAQAEERLISLVCERLRHGPVHVKAHRGTIERVLHVLGGNVAVPILASDRLIRVVEVYRKYGFASESLLSIDSPEGRQASACRSYVRLYSKGDGFPNEQLEGSSVTVSAYMASYNDPLLKYSDRAFKIALSNHADFEGTLAYVRATGAKRVVTDNTRNNGIELARALRDRLNIEAEPSSNRVGPRWQ